jgi:hypothetical protein
MQVETSNHVQVGTSTGTYSVAEAAQLLGVSPNTVRARCKSGALQCERVLRPQGEVIRVHLDVQDVQHLSDFAGAKQPDRDVQGWTSNHVQVGTSTGTSRDHAHVPMGIERAETMAGFLVPLLDQAMAPLVAALERSQAERQELAGQVATTQAEIATAQEWIRVLEAQLSEASQAAPAQRSWWRRLLGSS